jgi:hypothetical protein
MRRVVAVIASCLVVRRFVVPILAVAGIAVSLAAIPATATTGAGAGLPPPKTYVDPRVMGNYVGLFEINKVERRARVIGGEIAIDYTELPPAYPIGRIALRRYDSEGRQSSMTATLYAFEGAKDGKSVHGEILSQGDNSVIGEIKLFNPKEDSLDGTITLDGQSFDVSFDRYDDDDGPPPDTRVVQVGPRFVKATKPGWGKDPKAVAGEWDLVNGTPDPGAGSGPYAPLVRVAQSLVTGTSAPSSGTIAVDDQDPQTATLTLEKASGEQKLYLTDLKWDDASRSAVVRRDSATGPEVGNLNGTQTSGELDLTLNLDGKKSDLVFQHVQS